MSSDPNALQHAETQKLVAAGHERELRHSRLAVYHSNRFRRIDNNFPSTVARAYGGDLDAALGDTDDQVFTRVREWEIREGREPQNWRAASFEHAILDAGFDPDDLRGLIDDVKAE